MKCHLLRVNRTLLPLNELWSGFLETSTHNSVFKLKGSDKAAYRADYGLGLSVFSSYHSFSVHFVKTFTGVKEA